MDTRLKPCPYCAAGNTEIIPHTFWTGQRTDTVSVEIKHWCGLGVGFPRVYISASGRDEAEAIAAWNTRTTPKE